MRSNKQLLRIGIAATGVLCAIIAHGAETKPISGLNMRDFQKGEAQVKWENNPFVRNKDAQDYSVLTLTAIVYSDEDAAALISGQIVRNGAKLGLNEIVAIKKDHVLVRNESGIYKLAFAKSTTREKK